MVRQGVSCREHMFTVTATESTKGNLTCLCRGSAGLAGCQADSVNPAVLLVAQVSSLVLEKKSILPGLLKHTETLSMPMNQMGQILLAVTQVSLLLHCSILCRHTEGLTIRQTRSAQSHTNPRPCYVRCWFHSFLQEWY